MSLRERKKERTMCAIQEAAVRLFSQRGFGSTTVADIADAAEVSPRTVYSYCGSKEHVLFCDAVWSVETLRAKLDARDPGEMTFDVLRAWLAENLSPDGEPGPIDPARRRIIDSTPELVAHERAIAGEFERALADSIALDLGEAPGDLRPRLAAAAAIAALMSAKPEGEEIGTEGDVLERLEAALVFLRAGLDAMRIGVSS